MVAKELENVKRLCKEQYQELSECSSFDTNLNRTVLVSVELTDVCQVVLCEQIREFKVSSTITGEVVQPFIREVTEGLSVVDGSVHSMTMAALESIGANFEVLKTSIQQVRMPVLKTVHGDVTIRHNDELTLVEMPSLQVVARSLSVVNNTKMTCDGLDFDHLGHACHEAEGEIGACNHASCMDWETLKTACGEMYEELGNCEYMNIELTNGCQVVRCEHVSEFKVVGTCQNTCHHLNDGECDDGGPGADFAECAYATDCHDCCTKDPTRPECEMAAVDSKLFDRHLVQPFIRGISGSFTVAVVPARSLNMIALEWIGADANIFHTSVRDLSMPMLNSIDGNLTIRYNNDLNLVTMPKLQTDTSNILMSHNGKMICNSADFGQLDQPCYGGEIGTCHHPSCQEWDSLKSSCGDNYEEIENGFCGRNIELKSNCQIVRCEWVREFNVLPSMPAGRIVQPFIREITRGLTVVEVPVHSLTMIATEWIGTHIEILNTPIKDLHMPMLSAVGEPYCHFAQNKHQ